METIELRISDAPGGHGHLFIIYTNRTKEEFIVRAGPGVLNVLDRIDVEIGPYTAKSRDWVPPGERTDEDSILLERGQNLEDKYLNMAFFAQLVEQANIGYDTLAAVVNDDSSHIVNSNSLVAAALAEVGLPITKDDLPPSAEKRPPAGFENGEALQGPIAGFLANTFDSRILDDDVVFNEVKSRLQDDFVQRHRGQLEHLVNFTNGRHRVPSETKSESGFSGYLDAMHGQVMSHLDSYAGQTAYPKHLLEPFEGIDVDATIKSLQAAYPEQPDKQRQVLAGFIRALHHPDRSQIRESYERDVLPHLVFQGGRRWFDSPVSQSGAEGVEKRLGSQTDFHLGQVAEGGQTTARPANSAETPRPEADHQRRSGRAMPDGKAAGSRNLADEPETDSYQTSFDRFRRIGLDEHEEQAAVAAYQAYLQKSFLDMNGDRNAAEELAIKRFQVDWGLSELADAPAGTVLHHPVEKVYPKDGANGHDYVRRVAEAFLAKRGLDAKQVFVTPNKRTGSDWKQGGVDEQGLGPRMTLSFEDPHGLHHVLTETFQVPISNEATHPETSPVAEQIEPVAGVSETVVSEPQPSTAQTETQLSF